MKRIYNGIYRDKDGYEYHHLKWKTNKSVCPKCKVKCETLIGECDDNKLYDLADRCPGGCYEIHIDEL